MQKSIRLWVGRLSYGIHPIYRLRQWADVFFALAALNEGIQYPRKPRRRQHDIMKLNLTGTRHETSGPSVRRNPVHRLRTLTGRHRLGGEGVRPRGGARLEGLQKPHGKVPIKRITVLLAEDHPIVRKELIALLKAEDDIEVVAEAANGRQAVELAKKFHPTVVILDIAMPLLNGLEATQQILKFMPKAKVLMLSAHMDDAYVEQVIALGAVGYLVKQQLFAIPLVEVIRKIQNGSRFVSPGISRGSTLVR